MTQISAESTAVHLCMAHLVVRALVVTQRAKDTWVWAAPSQLPAKSRDLESEVFPWRSGLGREVGED